MTNIHSPDDVALSPDALAQAVPLKRAGTEEVCPVITSFDVFVNIVNFVRHRTWLEQYYILLHEQGPT